MRYAIFNGKLILLKDASVPITNKGWFFDFAVYDSLKVIQGKLFFPEYHIERMLESARILKLKHRFSRSELIDWLATLVSKNNLTDALVRIILIGDPDERDDVELFMFPVGGLTFYPHGYYSKGVKVITYLGERHMPQAKSKELLLGFLALREAKKHGALDALLIDNDGNIREGTRSNFFAIKGATLITPPAAKILEGITKKIVLEVARPYFKIKEEDIQLKRIQEYDELIITSTSKNVMPISQVDDIKFPPPFPKTKIIQKAFRDYYKK